MAQAYKCDICGKFYEGHRTRQIAVGMSPSCCTDNVNRYEGHRTRQIAVGMSPSCCTDNVNRYDVCTDCLSSFYVWKESRNPDHKSAFEDKEDQ